MIAWQSDNAMRPVGSSQRLHYIYKEYENADGFIRLTDLSLPKLKRAI